MHEVSAGGVPGGRASQKCEAASQKREAAR